MNSDEFEKRLEHQTIRSIPSEWRSAILSEAENALARQFKTQNSKFKTFLNELFWPCPQAWVGLAAIWIVILVLNFTSQEATPKFAKSEPPSRDFILAMKEQRRLYLELAGLQVRDVSEPPKTRTPGPSSQRKIQSRIA